MKFKIVLDKCIGEINQLKGLKKENFLKNPIKLVKTLEISYLCQTKIKNNEILTICLSL
jgi:hypothetical protein